jgi:anthranilate synthase component II
MRILVFDNYDSFTYNLVHLVEKITNVDVEVFRNDKINLEQVGKYDKIILSPGPGLPKDAGLMPDLIKEYASKKSILGVCLGHQAIGEAFGGKLVNLEKVYHGIATPVVVNRESGIVNRESGTVNRESGPERSGRESGIGNRESGVGVKSNEENLQRAKEKETNTEANSSINQTDSRFPIHDSRLRTADSRFPIHDSRLFLGLPAQFEVGRYHSWVVSEEGFPSELEITARDENGYIMALQHKTYDLQGVQFHPESVLTPLGEKIIANWLKI